MLDDLFHGLMATIDNVNELKVTLFCLWAFEQRDAANGLYWLRRADFDGLNAEVHGLDEDAIDDGLDCAVLRRTLLKVEMTTPSGVEAIYLRATPEAEAALATPGGFAARIDAAGHLDVLPPRPSVYKIYEENIGPLTGLIGDALRDLVTDYGENWVEDAIAVAVERNIRTLAYVKGVLRGWRKDGRRDANSGRHLATDEKSAAGKYADFFER